MNGWPVTLRVPNLRQRGTNFAMNLERAETIQHLALFRRGDFRIELDHRSSLRRPMRLPPLRSDLSLLNDLMNSVEDTRIAGRSRHREGQHTSMQTDSILEDAQANQRYQK